MNEPDSRPRPYRHSRVSGNPDSNMDRQDFCIGLERYRPSTTVPGRYRILSILSIHV